MDITQAQFNLAKNITSQIKQIIANRSTYIEKHNIPQDIHLPKALWDDDVVRRLSAKILECDYDTINHLRWYTVIFTGVWLNEVAGAQFLGKPVHTNNWIQHQLWLHNWDNLLAVTPHKLLIDVPEMLGETGSYKGKLVNNDVYVYHERLALLHFGGVLDYLKSKKQPKVLEIGSGYGGLAYLVKKTVPNCNYWCCDLPESLPFSSLYLNLTLPEYQHSFYPEKSKDFCYLPNYMIDEIKQPFDLAINTLSFSEMTAKQVNHYLAIIKSLLTPDGMLFEQNHDNASVGGCSCANGLPAYFANRNEIKPPAPFASTQGTGLLWT